MNIEQALVDRSVELNVLKAKLMQLEAEIARLKVTGNCQSDTPKTDAAIVFNPDGRYDDRGFVTSGFARMLERENAELRSRVASNCW